MVRVAGRRRERESWVLGFLCWRWWGMNGREHISTHQRGVLFAAAASPGAQVTEVPPFSADANAVLDKLAAEFGVEDAMQVCVCVVVGERGVSEREGGSSVRGRGFRLLEVCGSRIWGGGCDAGGG